ncbi:LOW QUALITY PROTEIN: hypothetical protein U9M48_028476 [Paspalum notatum var. saurae]|uniref:Integrase catalytic domain-containing protein n=1 Tax=Paspalum notatum var. saurae TaxID=547442 RepID=A0AAQ3TXA7_PASNO
MSGASNHMTGRRGAFSKLDSSITGTFGDNSVVDIAGKGTILFSCSNGGHRALTGVYYIPWRWHAQFGHLSFDALGWMARKGMVCGLPAIEHDPLELVHDDLCGPIKPATHGGRRYFLLLVDDSSRFMWLRLLTAKDHAVEAIKEIKARAEMEMGKKLKVLRTDRGGEFDSRSSPITAPAWAWNATSQPLLPAVEWHR